jgi:hypothetical protein
MITMFRAIGRRLWPPRDIPAAQVVAPPPRPRPRTWAEVHDAEYAEEMLGWSWGAGPVCGRADAEAHAASVAKRAADAWAAAQPQPNCQECGDTGRDPWGHSCWSSAHPDVRR